MKKQNKMILVVLVLLLAAVATLAIVHAVTREKVPEGAIAVHSGEKVSYVKMEDLALVNVQGTVVNGKGEKKEISEQGIRFADFLRKAGIDTEKASSVSVSAADEYSATLTGEELNETGKVYLIKGDDGLQLIVFGDENMKRSVRGVASVDVQY